MEKISDANRVREFAIEKYIRPARARHDKTVQIIAGEVHKGVGLTNRVPLVCQALQSRKFLEQNRLVLIKAEGPPKGLGTRLTLTYALSGEESGGTESRAFPFLKLRGIGRDLFKSLGGAERFLREERERFHDDR